MLKLAKFLKPYKLAIVFTLIVTFIQTLTLLLIPFYTARIINNGVLNGDIDYIVETGFTMILIALFSGVASIFTIYLSSNIATKFGKDVRLSIFKKATFLSVSDFKNIGASSMITRNTNDVNQVQMSLLYILQFMLPAPLMAIGAFILSFSKDPLLTGILFITLLILSFISFVICAKAIPLFMQLQGKMDNITKTLREIIIGVRVIRAFNREDYEKERFYKISEDYGNLAIKVNKTFAFFLPLIILGMNLSAIAILWVGGIRVNTGNLQIGDIMAVIEYSYYIMYSVMMFSFVLIYIPRAQISANRINEILDISTANENTDISNNSTNVSNPISLEFKNVSFAYPDAEEHVLSDISFLAKAGDVVAVIGSTGSGKSTLASLLTGFYDVSSGNILINGTNIKDLSKKELLSKIGYIPQKPFLFSGTIEDTIKYGKKDATMEEIEHAAQIAQATEFISKKENGYKEAVSQSGNNLSGGQKQRLCIARALAKKPEIYIFDDSFSALDFKTESNLRKELKSELKDSILLVVAQRISTIKEANTIIVLNNGNLVGLGNHETLMETCDVYKQFAMSQLSSPTLD